MSAHIIHTQFCVNSETNTLMENSSPWHMNHLALEEDRRQVIAAQLNKKDFEVLYKKYYERILKFVYQRLDSKEKAYDITHQVFLKALVALDKYEVKQVPFSAWLHRIAINELNTFFRKNSRERTLNVNTDDLAEMATEVVNENPETKLTLLTKIISTLPEDELQLIEMRFFEKKSFREIGEVISATENNTKVKTYRLLNKIKKLIQKEENIL